MAYHSTSQGPEVLAVGEEEIDALRKRLTEGEWHNLKTWQF